MLHQFGYLLAELYVFFIASLHELGIEDGHIPDQAMKASSRLDNNHGAGRGRLNQGPTGSQGTAWCAGETNSDQYLQIDLSEYKLKPGVLRSHEYTYHGCPTSFMNPPQVPLQVI